MAECRWIKMSLILILLLQLTAITEQGFLSFTARVGDDVTLSCENAMDSQDNCDSVTWLFTDSRSKATVVVVSGGQISENAKAKSDRLSVTANCSLVIKKVTREDVGRYTCRQFDESGQQGQDAVVELSVVTMTEHEYTDEVTLHCSVRTYERCTHTVKWLFHGQDATQNHQIIKTSQSLCSASVTFLTSLYIYTSRYKLFTCEVTDGDRVQVFPFRSQSSGEKPGEDTTTATTESATTTENNTTAGANDPSPKPQVCTAYWSALDYIMLVMRVAELLLITVITVHLIRASGNQRPPDDNTVHHDGTKDLPEDLFLFGKINENTKSDRLSVTANCSLVIKKVTAEDAGQYICQHQSVINQVYLSVVDMTEHNDTDEVTLTCSVSPECVHTVKWLYVDKDNKDMMMSPSDCSASVTTSLSESKHHEFFKCEVTDDFSGNTKQFIYQDSDEKTGEDEKTSTSWWWFIILPVVLAVLFVVVLIRWKRSKGNKTQVDTNTADPEDGVSYTSVSFTKTTNSKAQVQGNVGDDEGDAVTYSTVKASFSA
ncbi:uncharacterized protein LOC144466592 [Epinephelus lanceolatus]